MAELETAAFGAGCFWGVEDAFMGLKGVKETAVGFMGGNKENPTYGEVCGGETGHAETVQVKFDPEEVSYEELLDKFWQMHDPTQVDMQGPDIGSQYRSVIFYYSERQKKLAEESKEALEASGKAGGKVATQIVPAGKFWKAEEHHQKYLQKHGRSSCHVG